MKKRLECRAKKQPTREEVGNYVYRNGLGTHYVDIFLSPSDLDYPEQFWEAVRKDIDISDFDRWRYFQKVIDCKLDYETFRQIAGIFYEHDIEILEMPCDSETIW